MTVLTAPPPPDQPAEEPPMLPEQAAKLLREFLLNSGIAHAFPHSRFTLQVVDGGIAEIEVAPRFKGKYLLMGGDKPNPSPGA